MLYVDMHHKLDILFLEDLVGIVTDSQSNIKSINNSKLLIKDKFYKWESLNIINNAEILSWNIPTNGKELLIDLEDGLILKTTIKL